MGTTHKVGDVVTIKSLEWYEKNKESNGYIHPQKPSVIIFNSRMAGLCGETFEIGEVFKTNLGDNSYYLKNDQSQWNWQDWMFEEEGDFSIAESLLSSLGIEDYTEITYMKAFDPNKWIQSTTTKEFSLWWNVEGHRVLIIRKIGIFKII